ncbi:MAG: undecaprenyl-diphosphate phosphatase [Chlorobi bacterium]|nr:undecaprenyl-diphosphate phosphatase [Chlorobiota bacterium]
MGWLEALVLGIVQGLTEFLPVSSSGHLEIVKALFGEQLVAKESLFMTVMLHGATALSTIVIFRKDLLEIFKGLFQFRWNKETQFSVKIILSMIPAAGVGIVFNDQIETLFEGQILLVGFMLLITAALLLLADRAKTTNKDVSYFDAIVIGISQAIAILPGISRSGATISTSVILGVDRAKAARFSFLMVVPLILGKMAKDLLDAGSVSISNESFLSVSIGFIAAFITGLVACSWMITLVKNSKLTYFAIYCAIVGVGAIVLSLA